MSFKRFRKSLKNNFIFYFLYLLIAFLRFLPRKAALAIGGWAGALSHLLLCREKKRALQNLRMVWPEYNDFQIKTLARQTFVNLAKSGADAVRLKNWKDKDFRENVWIEGLTRFDKAYQQGKGLVAVTGHISNFEIIPAYFSWLGYQTAVIGRELYDPRLNKMLIENRGSIGTENIPNDASPKVVMRALKAGKALGVLVDQNSSRVSNIKVDFLGKLANTPKGPFALALKLGCPVVPLAIARTKGDFYRIMVGEELKTDSKKDEEETILELGRQTNRFLESIIKQYPDQWVWMHKKWD